MTSDQQKHATQHYRYVVLMKDPNVQSCHMLHLEILHGKIKTYAFIMLIINFLRGERNREREGEKERERKQVYQA